MWQIFPKIQCEEHALVNPFEFSSVWFCTEVPYYLVTFDLRRYLCDEIDTTKAHSLTNWVSCFVNGTFYFILVLQLPYSRFTFKPLTIRNLQFRSYFLRPFEGCFCVLPNLLDQDISHRFDVLVAIICAGHDFVTTRVAEVIRVPSSAKTDSGVAAGTIIFVVSKDTNSRFGVVAIGTNCVETFLVTVGLQRGPRPNKLLPRVTAQWSSSVFAISNQWRQGSGLVVDDNRLELLSDLHSKTDLVKRCVPISR